MQYYGRILESKDVVTKEYVDTMSDYVETFPNENLFLNGFFIGGGSQQEGSAFPINQRGQTSYSNTGNCIDGWRLASPHTMSFLSDGIKLTVNGSASLNYLLQQNLKNLIVGQTYTLSMLISQNTTTSGIRLRNGGSAGGNISEIMYGTGLKTYTFNAGSAQDVGIMVSDRTADNGNYVVIQAAKLEFGQNQTLAHNEGDNETPNWVLNEIPIFNEELLRCQTRYQLFRTQNLRPTYRQDYRPVMDESTASDPQKPNTGTISIGGTTYYYASSD